MDLHIVPVEDLPKYWELLLPYVESFVERARGRYIIDDVLDRLNNRLWTIWVVHHERRIRSVAMTQIVPYPQLKELQIIMCVGEEPKDWYFLIEKMEDYARLLDCKILIAITRPGWEKIMKGYKKTHVYLERDL